MCIFGRLFENITTPCNISGYLLRISVSKPLALSMYVENSAARAEEAVPVIKNALMAIF